MRLAGRGAIGVGVIAIVLSACTGTGAASPASSGASSAAPSASASTSGSASATPAATSAASPAEPSTSPVAAGPWLRAWLTQALPPQSVFSLPDALVITAGGVAVKSTPIPTVYPGPAVVPMGGRQLTPAGLAKITARAKALGLLDGKADFGSPSTPGAATGYIAFTVDGKPLEIHGNPGATIECIKAPCDPPPGTPEAFGTFWQELANLDWLGADAGPEQPFAPPVYSVLVGAAPAPDPNLGASVAIWPLATPIATFGTSVLSGHARCGTVTGADATTLAAALAKANALTQWTQSESTNATFGLTIRPLTDGQDACREIFGVG